MPPASPNDVASAELATWASTLVTQLKYLQANLADETLRSLSGRWRMKCSPSPVWADLEDFASNPGDRTQWKAEVRLLDGRLIDCRFAPLAGGATMTAFRMRDAGTGPKAIFSGTALKRA